MVIDECSQVNTLMWHRLAPLARLCQVIVMGNPEDQLLAVADSWLDVPLEVDVSETQLLRSMCGYRRLRLTEGKRSCSELWDLYSSMATTGWRIGQPLAEMIEAARALPRRGWADVNLVVSHARRRAVIRDVMAQRLAAESPAETLTIPKGTDANSQEIQVWPGVVLTAVLDGISRFGIWNAQLLIVQGWSGDSLRLRCQEGGEDYEVPLSWAAENLRHGAAICYAAIQARTCRGTVQLLDWTSQRFTRRMLCMGLSRATSIHNVWLGES